MFPASGADTEFLHSNKPKGKCPATVRRIHFHLVLVPTNTTNTYPATPSNILAQRPNPPPFGTIGGIHVRERTGLYLFVMLGVPSLAFNCLAFSLRLFYDEYECSPSFDRELQSLTVCSFRSTLLPLSHKLQSHPLTPQHYLVRSPILKIPWFAQFPFVVSASLSRNPTACDNSTDDSSTPA